MNTKRRLVLIGSLALTISSAAFASDKYRDEAEATAAGPASAVLVRVLKLTGFDAAQREQVLYQSEGGTLIPLNNLARIGAHLDPKQQGIPDGEYHDLTVAVANDLYVYNTGEAPIHTQINPQGEPTVLSLPGSVLVANGQAAVLALALDTGADGAEQAPSAVPESERDGEWRNRRHKHHSLHDEDDEGD